MTISEEQVAEFGMTFGLAFFIGYMLFIIWKLARDSEAGRFGSFVLFFVLAFGVFAFIAKHLIKWLLGL